MQIITLTGQYEMTSDILDLKIIFVVVVMILASFAIYYLPILTADEKSNSFSTQTEDNYLRRPGSDVMHQAMCRAAADNESLEALFDNPCIPLGGIYNETGISTIYRYVFTDPDEIEKCRQQNVSYSEFSIENRTPFYEIKFENETLVSIECITELPGYIVELQSEKYRVKGYSYDPAKKRGYRGPGFLMEFVIISIQMPEKMRQYLPFA